jgi:alkanesulfonate monooxygenase SsuD/methylene tetrahydromethanopterin reductase-like flavin-dependent oxidoreductase (luciferase family)
MRFGVYVNPQTPGPEDDGRLIHDTLAQVELAEQIGFEDVWITDHQFTGYNAYSDPVPLAAAVAMRTKKMHIGFAVAVLPLRNPINFVTQCNLLDQLSKGRFIPGLGAGNAPDEFAGYGLDANNRHAIMREFVAIMEQAWTAPPSGFRYSGKHFNGVVDGRIIPAPYQKPMPHIAYGTATPATLEMVGAKGWSFLAGPMDADGLASRIHFFMKGQDSVSLTQAQKDRAWAFCGFNRQFYVAAPGEDWRETIGEYIEIYIRKSAKANIGVDNLSKTDVEARTQGYLRNWLYAGTAEEIVARMTPLVKLGFGHAMCWFMFGHLPTEVAQRSMTRFATDVLPVLKQIEPDWDRLARIRAGEVSGQTRLPESPVPELAGPIP